MLALCTIPAIVRVATAAARTRSFRSILDKRMIRLPFVWLFDRGPAGDRIADLTSDSVVSRTPTSESLPLQCAF